MVVVSVYGSEVVPLKASVGAVEVSVGVVVVPVDVSVYDIPRRLKEAGSVPPATFKAVFGEAEEAHRALSPVAHVAAGKGIPPFLILHVASRAETKVQSHGFADKLKAAVEANTVDALIREWDADAAKFAEQVKPYLLYK